MAFLLDGWLESSKLFISMYCMYRWSRLASSCNFLSSPYGRNFLSKIYTQRESMYELFIKAEINKWTFILPFSLFYFRIKMSHSLRHVRLGRCQRRLVQPGQNMATAPPGGTTSRNLSSLGSTFNGSVTFNQWMPSLGQARGKNSGGLLGFPELTHHTGFADMERDCRRNRSGH